ncbi:hypothetical protein TBLA_0H00250 [Henningerozyma blattae CBS 6284]|uniref:Major facilitator superfamily (MFS) profile domain-containing protein n=1 Tax=Henningerozyma blattae (strain ATCC 34711 / CBS 6284 / DSM 70876 / NBRC 10599 / NRRL Y-10934 / UCD 77-7) TaxID=1071380 RepID=I2H7G6_HENB6|nr:hypothetical protein TBLA_0H00250 [Tetrapisispora blattae CBS 6284]CCH62318.1 hypothetical protein TBLA_0H00250 [Tetrapisispora blattae CBS 6284]
MQDLLDNNIDFDNDLDANNEEDPDPSMENGLNLENVDSDDEFDNNALHNSNDLGFKPTYKDILWKGKLVRTYDMDYKNVPLVKLQIFACLILFVVFGINDQTTGALMPTLKDKYNVSEVVLANIFLFQIGGYTISSLINEQIHRLVGVRGVVILACCLSITFYTLMFLEPPSFIYYICYVLPLGLSTGLLDCTGNVLVGGLVENNNEWMGIMHGMYGAASMATPPIASHFSESGHWNRFFLLPLTGSIIGLLISIPAFRYDNAIKYDYDCLHEEQAHHITETGSSYEHFINTDRNDSKKPMLIEINNNGSALEEGSILDSENNQQSITTLLSQSNTESGFALLKKPQILLYALYLFIYLGAEVGTGSWLLTFLLNSKSSDRIGMSYVTSSYWAGLTFGRFTLGFVTNRAFKNVYRASTFYSVLTVIAYTLFVCISVKVPGDPTNSYSPYFILFFIIMFLCGVFIGPLFPNASIVALQVLPKKYHVGGIGIAVAVGGCGCALLPYLIGIVSHAINLNLFPVLCWTMVVSFTLIWELYPKFIEGHDEYL